MKRNCRKSEREREQHDRAVRVRKMTDGQLCAYLDSLSGKEEDPSENPIIRFLELLRSPSPGGLSVSRGTLNKLRLIALETGLLDGEAES